MNRRHFILLLAAGVAALGLSGRLALYSAQPAPDNGQRVPVLVELFTSEGCSSCPPADRFLMRLENEQPVPGAEIIVLGQHVDYWDQQGWRDRFSSSQYTERQNQYAESFGNDQVYTPEMVVDGRREFSGSDESKAFKAIAESATRAK